MRKTVMVMLAVLLVAGAWSTASAWTLNFENGTEGATISSGIAGLQFTTTGGYDWVYGEAQYYNTSSNNGNIYNGGYYWMEDEVFAFLSTASAADAGRIDFTNQDGSFFSTGYCAGSNFYLEAYDKDGNLIDSDAGGPNRRYIEGNESGMGFLSVSSASNNIAYVLMHDTGNYWLADHMSGDATGVPDQTQGAVPEPATLLLFGLGLVGGAIRKRMAK